MGSRRDPRGEVATCACGESWFKLRGGTTEVPLGAVCLDGDGHVSGYTGVPHCVGCGQQWKPPRDRLNLVD